MMDSCTNPKKGLILHSGAIGDCLLTLPLAAYLKHTLSMTQVHFMGRLDAVGFYPRRSSIDHVRPIESLPLYRLFEPQIDFSLEDIDRLTKVFSGYEYIICFLGADHPAFEQNLLMTVHCSHSAEVTVLPLMPVQSTSEPLSSFYIRNYAQQLGLETPSIDLKVCWLVPTTDDQSAGRELLESASIDPDAFIVILHPGSGGRHKCWHPDNFLHLAGVFTARGLVPVFLFGPAEQERFAPALQEQFRKTAPVFNNLSLLETFQLLSQGDLFVGNDSGISHMAGAMGKKTIPVFGPTDSSLYRPLGPAVTVFHAQPKGFDAFCQEDVVRIFEGLGEMH
jgi:ADP-heptose:LPS heptosyltransferase